MTFLEHVQAQFFIYGPRVFWAVVIVVALWFVSGWVASLIRTMSSRLQVHPVVADLLAQVASTVLLIIGVICALGTLGINITAFWWPV